MPQQRQAIAADAGVFGHHHDSIKKPVNGIPQGGDLHQRPIE